MAQAFLLFDFGSDEEVAQRARLRVEAWKQAFRLGTKLQFKLDRKPEGGSENSQESKQQESKGKRAANKEGSEAKVAERIRLLIRLDFSAHEKHLFQTWLDRIPGEEPFKSAKPRAIQREAENFEQTVELFDSLD